MSALPVTSASPRLPLLLRALLKATWPNSRQAVVTKWLIMTCVPLSGYYYWGAVYFSSWWVFVRGTLLLAALATLCIVWASYLAVRIAQHYPEPGQVAQRTGLHFMSLVCISLSVSSSIMWWFDAVQLFGYQYNPITVPWLVLGTFVIAGVMVTLTEVTFALGQWQTNQLGTERLERERLQSQLTELKQQVNPHFLFNSLNSLSVLISEDPAQAERFVDELAKVYRYQLQATRSSQLPPLVGLVPLEAELRFLRAYAYLLCTRYGPGLELHIHSCEPPLAGTLLPLTLQTLVDNAIRHNVLSATQPLRIEVVPGANHVRVLNTRRRRQIRVPMLRDGLGELQARYQRLGPAHAVQVDASEEKFTVVVPLITP